MRFNDTMSSTLRPEIDVNRCFSIKVYNLAEKVVTADIQAISVAVMVDGKSTKVSLYICFK